MSSAACAQSRIFAGSVPMSRAGKRALSSIGHSWGWRIWVGPLSRQPPSQWQHFAGTGSLAPATDCGLRRINAPYGAKELPDGGSHPGTGPQLFFLPKIKTMVIIASWPASEGQPVCRLFGVDRAIAARAAG